MVSSHGTSFFVDEETDTLQNSLDSMATKYMEKVCLEKADLVTFPSYYGLSRYLNYSIALPQNTFVIPNLLPPENPVTNYSLPKLWRSPQSTSKQFSQFLLEFKKDKESQSTFLNHTPPGKSTLIFFGKLAKVKGIFLFLDSLDLITSGNFTQIAKVIFLGNPDVGTFGDLKRTAQYINLRAKNAGWNFDVEIVAGKTSEECRTILYSHRSTAITIIPSLIEMSPYAVTEAILEGACIIATQVGGIPELLHPVTQRVLVPPSAALLSEKILDVIQQGTVLPSMLYEHNDIRMLWKSFLYYSNSQREERHRNIPETDSILSVVIASYNRKHLLRRAIRSACLQEVFFEYEIIVVDDASTDESVNQYLNGDIKDDITRFCSEDTTLRVVRHNKNGFLGKVRNSGLHVAKGNFITFLDDDDILKPNALAKYMRAALFTNADVLTDLTDLIQSSVEQTFPPPVKVRYLSLGPAIDVGLARNYFGSYNIFAKTQLLKQIGGYTEEFGGCEDWEISAKLAFTTSKFFLIPDSLFWYEDSAKSMSKKMDKGSCHKRVLRVYERHVPPSLRSVFISWIGSQIENPKEI